MPWFYVLYFSVNSFPKCQKHGKHVFNVMSIKSFKYIKKCLKMLWFPSLKVKIFAGAPPQTPSLNTPAFSEPPQPLKLSYTFYSSYVQFIYQKYPKQIHNLCSIWLYILSNSYLHLGRAHLRLTPATGPINHNKPRFWRLK